MQSAFIFKYKILTQSVSLFVYKNVPQSALFFGYKNVTQSAFFFKYKNVPVPSANFKNSMKNRVTQSVLDFCIYKRNANCHAFCEVSGFLYINRHVTQSVMLFLYKYQVRNFHEKSRSVKCRAFCI